MLNRNQYDTPEKMIDLIKRSIAEVNKHQQIMTPYEKLTAQEEIEGMKKQYHPAISQHVFGKHNQAVAEVVVYF